MSTQYKTSKLETITLSELLLTITAADGSSYEFSMSPDQAIELADTIDVHMETVEVAEELAEEQKADI